MFVHKMFARQTLILSLMATCGGTSLTVNAQQSTAEQLQRINESIAILSAQRQEIELRAQIATKQFEIDRASHVDVTNIDRARHPVVRSIEGADGKMSATLVFGSGVQQVVRRGDSIPGGWTITRISIDAVQIVRGKEKVRLAYGYEPPPAMPTMSAMPSITAVPPLNPALR